MKHPNKKAEAIRKRRAKFIMEARRISCFNWWLRDNHLER